MEHHAEVLSGGIWRRPHPSWLELAAAALVLSVVILPGTGARQMITSSVAAEQAAISLSPAAWLRVSLPGTRLCYGSGRERLPLAPSPIARSPARSPGHGPRGHSIRPAHLSPGSRQRISEYSIWPADGKQSRWGPAKIEASCAICGTRRRSCHRNAVRCLDYPGRADPASARSLWQHRAKRRD